MVDTIQILLVDDHAMVRKGIRAFLGLQLDLNVIGEAGTGEEALALVEAEAPDVLLLDIMMPGIGGVETARRIKAISPCTAIIALTSSQETNYVLEIMTAGASAYLLKDIGPKELGDAIRRVACGEVVIEPRLAKQLFTSLSTEKLSGAPSLLKDLTHRELEILRLIADGLSNAVIAERLFLSEKTVKTHVSNILNKLQLADRTQAAVFAWKQGMKKS